MKVREVKDNKGRIIKFKVSNAFLSHRGLVRIAKTISGVIIKRKPLFFAPFGEEVFCDFVVDGKHFIALEPFGDDPEYWITPIPANKACKQILKVRDAFVRYSTIKALWPY